MNANRFRLEEATIADLHAAIQAGQTTCVEIVQGYIDRVRAYNGVPSVLVTEDGESIPEATGTIRGGDPIEFSYRNGQGVRAVPRPGQLPGQAPGIWPDGAHCLRPDGAAAVRDDCCQKEGWPGERSGHPEPAR